MDAAPYVLFGDKVLKNPWKFSLSSTSPKDNIIDQRMRIEKNVFYLVFCGMFAQTLCKMIISFIYQ